MYTHTKYMLMGVFKNKKFGLININCLHFASYCISHRNKSAKRQSLGISRDFKQHCLLENVGTSDSMIF